MKKMWMALIMGCSFSLTAAATEVPSNEELIVALMSNLNKLVLVEADGSVSQKNLAQTLGAALSRSKLVDKIGEQAVIVDIHSSCEATDVGKFGEVYLTCTLGIGDGDFERTKDGYKGPLLESGITLVFEANTSLQNPENPIYFKKKKTKVTITRAG